MVGHEFKIVIFYILLLRELIKIRFLANTKSKLIFVRRK